MDDYNGLKLLGVVGNPVSHSLSPVFQNYLIKRYNLNWIYIPLCVEVEKIQDFFEWLKSIQNFVGCNITIPFKESAFRFCDILSDEAKMTGAVNTVFFKKNKLYGYNTDVYGIISSMRHKLKIHSLSDKRILMIGAGGVARAAIYALLKMGAKELILVNRSIERAELLKQQAEENFGLKVIVKPFDILNNLIVTARPHLLINATSVWLKGESFNIDFQKVWKDCKIFDMVYSKDRTQMVNAAIKNGLKAIDGFDMLVYQGVKSFSIWSGITDIDVSKVAAYLRKKVGYGKGSDN